DTATRLSIWVYFSAAESSARHGVRSRGGMAAILSRFAFEGASRARRPHALHQLSRRRRGGTEVPVPFLPLRNPPAARRQSRAPPVAPSERTAGRPMRQVPLRPQRRGLCADSLGCESRRIRSPENWLSVGRGPRAAQVYSMP